MYEIRFFIVSDNYMSKSQLIGGDFLETVRMSNVNKKVSIKPPRDDLECEKVRSVECGDD